MSKKPFTAQELREHLSYDPETGQFVWLKGKKAGKVAGSFDGRGYRQIGLLYSMCKAHRLAWLYMTGEWPEGFIDHINHVTADNRFSNLRVADAVLNGQNQIRAQKRSSHGFMGVKRNGNRYESRISVCGKRIALGTYGTPDEAHAAYLSAKRSMHAGCTI